MIKAVYWLVWLGLYAGMVHPASRAHTLILGKVSTNPQKHYRQLKPLVDYVAERMQDLGIQAGDVRLVPNERELARLLREGKVDWMTDSVFPALFYQESAGAEIILKRWKKGVPSYRSVFITRADAPIHELADLKGKVLVFEDPGSTTAFFWPAVELLRRGYVLQQVAAGQRPERQSIGYRFTSSEINISMQVAEGKAAAGVYSDLDWEDREHTPARVRARLRIFHRTRPLPRMLELVRGDWHEKLRFRLRQILLQLHLDPKGAKVLKAFQKSRRFEALSTEDWDMIRQARRLFVRFHEFLLSQ